METTYQIGNVIEATASVQSMKKGHTYRVERIYSQRTPFGTFVSYGIVDTADRIGQPFPICNAHLITKLAPNSDTVSLGQLHI